MNYRRAILAMGLAALTACLPLFGATSAMLSEMGGPVSVNGQAAAIGSAIVAGDVVATSAQGAARMVLPGALVVAAANTNLRLENLNQSTAVRLNRGAVDVTGQLPVEIGASTIVPATAQTRFKVYALSGRNYVQALTGSLAVKYAGSTTKLVAGNTAVFAAPAPQGSVTTGGLNSGGGITPGGWALIVAGVGVGVATVWDLSTGLSSTAASAAASPAQ